MQGNMILKYDCTLLQWKSSEIIYIGLIFFKLQKPDSDVYTFYILYTHTQSMLLFNKTPNLCNY